METPESVSQSANGNSTPSTPPEPKLGRIAPQTKTKKVSLELKGGEVDALEGYQAFYQAHYGEKLPAEDFLIEIFRQFIDRDKSFKKWLREEKGLDLNALRF